MVNIYHNNINNIKNSLKSVILYSICLETVNLEVSLCSIEMDSATCLSHISGICTHTRSA